MTRSRLLLLALVAAGAIAFFALGGHRFLSPDNLRALHADVQAVYLSHPLETGLAFFAAYVAVTGLSLPGAAAMTLLAGAIFGLAWGIVLVSFASSIGATIAFLVSRFLLRDWVQARFGERLAPVNDGIRREGAFYLFALRLVPLFPFFVVNLVPAFLDVPAGLFVWTTLVGIIPGTFVFATVGAGLGSVFDRGQPMSPADVLTPQIVTALLGLAVLALIPVVYKWLLRRRHG